MATPSFQSLARPAHTSAALAFISTQSSSGPSSPLSSRRSVAAFSAALPEATADRGWRGRPKSSGLTCSCSTSPLWSTLHTSDGPCGDSSSIPSSSPCTTSAAFTPRRWRLRANNSPSARL